MKKKEERDSYLKQEHHPQNDIFVIDALDAIIKDDLPSMEFPFYSLSKKPDTETRRYEYKDRWIEFLPSVKGLPTIYDKDLVIYCISQMISAMQDGQEVSNRVEIDPYHFFVFTNRAAGGRAYEALRDSLDRLNGTRFRTNIKVSDEVMIDRWQGMLDEAELKTNPKTGRPEKLVITLSSMLMKVVKEKAVLTLHRDYFRLKKPLERRIYELVRKHLGLQKSWPISLANLHLKSGSRASEKQFRQAIKELAKTNHLPDYLMEYDAKKDLITWTPRDSLKTAYRKKPEKDSPQLETWVFEKAREIAPSLDVYQLEQDWLALWKTKPEHEKELDDPNKAFLGYCKWRQGKE